jgi:hypothetical protein
MSTRGPACAHPEIWQRCAAVQDLHVQRRHAAPAAATAAAQVGRLLAAHKGEQGTSVGCCGGEADGFYVRLAGAREPEGARSQGWSLH